MKEIWKDIKGYEGLYQVSNLGNIKSVNRIVRFKNGYRCLPEKILKISSFCNSKYMQVNLSKNSKIKTYSLHRLVAETFIPNPNNLPCVNHKDENPQNNCVDNLEWCTHKYNSNYGTLKKRQSEKMKHNYTNENFKQKFEIIWAKNQVNRRKKVCQLDLNNNLIKIWESAYSTDAEGYKHSNVINCANKLRKTHHKYIWMWYEDYMKESECV